MRIARYVTSDLSLCYDRPLCDLRRNQNFIPMGVESYLVLWVFTHECCHPNRFRVELMLVESFEIGRLDFPNRETFESTHCFCLTTKTQRRRPRSAAIAAATSRHRSLQRMVRRHGHRIFDKYVKAMAMTIPGINSAKTFHTPIINSTI